MPLTNDGQFHCAFCIVHCFNIYTDLCIMLMHYAWYSFKFHAELIGLWMSGKSRQAWKERTTTAIWICHNFYLKHLLNKCGWTRGEETRVCNVHAISRYFHWHITWYDREDGKNKLKWKCGMWPRWNKCIYAIFKQLLNTRKMFVAFCGLLSVIGWADDTSEHWFFAAFMVIFGTNRLILRIAGAVIVHGQATTQSSHI